ncbi:unnamed protein product [Polarella glacialis]|uniref:WW domain-containing protein n=1 Tax=Polarella glacialis TaxID=89957 RepID=A0A813H0Z6_POLGL|nr:unnamed protein product [Polarella glacialis]
MEEGRWGMVPKAGAHAATPIIRDNFSDSGPLQSALSTAGAEWTLVRSCLAPAQEERVTSESAFVEGVRAVVQLSFNFAGCSSQEGEVAAAAFSAFSLLKRGCLRALRMGVLGSLAFEASHAYAVLSFLVEFAARHSALVVAEAFHILLSSDEWAACLDDTPCRRSGPSIVQQMRDRLSEDSQAALGLQHKRLLALLPEEICRRAVERQSPELQEAWRLKEELSKLCQQDDAPARGARMGLRFQSSVMEYRFDPGSRSGGHVASGIFTGEEGTGSPEGWRATTTPDGSRYFYHTRTKESRLEPPTISSGSPLGGSGGSQPLKAQSWPQVGECVEIFSHTADGWCTGYIEKVSKRELYIAFQLPDARINEWSKKSLPRGHPDLRMVGGATSAPSLGSDPFHVRRDGEEVCSAQAPQSDATSVSQGTPNGGALLFPAPSGFLATDLPDNWTPEELALYRHHFMASSAAATSGGGGSGKGDSGDSEKERGGSWPMDAELSAAAQLQAEFLARSGLHQATLREIWQVGNPDLRPELGQEEFQACCRLIAHCQAMVSKINNQKLIRQLEAGGGRLRSQLRSSCLPSPPPVMPDFGATVTYLASIRTSEELEQSTEIAHD